MITEHLKSPVQLKLQQLSGHAISSNHRYLIVVSGSYDWACQAARDIIALLKRDAVCFSDSEFTGCTTIKMEKAEKYLGREFDNIVFDAYSGFFPSVTALVEGLLKGGGLFILITPELDAWPHRADRFQQCYSMYPYDSSDMHGYFLTRFSNLLKNESTVSRISQDHGDEIYQPDVTCMYTGKNDKAVYASEDQQIAVEKIIHVAEGHRNRPLVLLSNRGRGKSAALGIASACLIKKEFTHITICGPGKKSVEAVFRHAGKILGPDVTYHDGKIIYGHSIIEFIPPDELIRKPISTNILMIDEAASIPSPILESLCHLYHRIVFSSTVYGYEGSGKGFELKFLKKLDQINPGVKIYYLNEPVRWSRNDPLENFFFKSFLLDARMANIEFEPVAGKPLVNRVSGKDLSTNEGLICELYSLLISAHYKTTPNDLRMLMDSPYISIFYLEQNGHVYAAILVSDEGGIDNDLAGEVSSGSRRINGHILPQTLLAEFSQHDSTKLRYARIMRLAVHPDVQEKGIGTGFLNSLISDISSSYDFIGASFGSDARLLRFWTKVGFSTIKIGHKKNAYSGHHSITVLMGVSKQGLALLGSVQNRFYENLLYTLTDTHRYLECDLVRELLVNYSEFITGRLAADEKDTIRLFSNANKTFDSCSSVIYKLLLASINSQTIFKLQDMEFNVLVQRILQRQDEEFVIEENHLVGKKMLVATMKEAIRKLMVDVT